MRIITREGCTSDAIIIDGKHFQDYTKEEQEVIANKMIDKLREAYMKNQIQISDLICMFQYDTCDTGTRCEQCNDTIFTTTYTI